MSKKLLVAAIAAVPMLCAAAEPASNAKEEGVKRVTPTPRISQERLDRIRQSLVSQIAVYDTAEQAMRAPTTEEAAALALPAAGTLTAFPLAGGGVALRGDVSTASLAVAVRGADGKVTIGHDPAPKSAVGATNKGDGHAR